MAISMESGGDDTIAAINVTPLVDITLVLLVVFMVTATYVAREAIEVDLPRAASGGQLVGPTLAFALDREGRLFLDGAPATDAAAREAVRAAVERSPEARAIISADRAVSHGRVIELIDLVKQAGLTRFAIDVERADGAAG
jgi:biopolymer transport protein TolR